MAVHIYGIRHHGPGSARSLRAALTALAPDIVLVEGPPDAQEVLSLLAHEQMTPPVALLIYAPDQPQRAVYYPFAAFSPEWQAIHYALAHNIPVRFMDLPQSHRFALEPEPTADEQPIVPPQEQTPDESTPNILPVSDEDSAADPRAEPEHLNTPATMTDIRQDPLRWMALAAGFADGESWWEEMVEQRRDSGDLFQGILEMMTALRDAASREANAPNSDAAINSGMIEEERREAFMRQTIRAAQREGYSRVAVVCGAWHAPALADMPPTARDAETLRGLPKIKTAATWVPWTDERLTLRSGYGAGVVSPAWYQHLWDEERNVVARWMTHAAALLRAEDLPASPASVIEGVRLAETLACVRGRPLPGLSELWEAAQAVFCFGSDVPMRLIAEKLVVGERLGQVPDDTPMLPIQQDLHREQKRLRIAPEAAQRDIDLDQRKPNDLDKSRLLHRLNLLGISWGTLVENDRGKGTFHEYWRLRWQPEYEVALIEANVWGNTILAAATGRVREQAQRFDALPTLTDLVERALLADLPECIGDLMTRLQNLAAITSDIPHLMEALSPLANVLRYGNVRQTDTSMVSHVVDGLMARICIGLPMACASLNPDGAAEMFPRLLAVDHVVGVLQRADHRAAWQATLEQMADQRGLPGLLAGRCCRLLLDKHIWPADEVGVRMNLALSTVAEPAHAAAWVEGLLRDSGVLLLHDDVLWNILDAWVSDLKGDDFTQLLPLLRRTFATFEAAERRQMGQRARNGVSRAAAQDADKHGIDPERAARVLPLVARLLGLQPPCRKGARHDDNQ